jgi:hypothetical protein
MVDMPAIAAEMVGDGDMVLGRYASHAGVLL